MYFRSKSEELIEIINRKLNKLIEIKDEMLSGSNRKRPNWLQISNSINDWILNENEIKLLTIFDSIPESFKLSENSFFLNFMESKFTKK